MRLITCKQTEYRRVDFHFMSSLTYVIAVNRNLLLVIVVKCNSKASDWTRPRVQDDSCFPIWKECNSISTSFKSRPTPFLLKGLLDSYNMLFFHNIIKVSIDSRILESNVIKNRYIYELPRSHESNMDS